jgi:hypothetical protein
LISTARSQNSGTLPRLWVETSITRPSARRSLSSSMIWFLGGHVDAGERLVEQDDLAFLRQRPGQEHALLLAAGQFADLALAELAMPTRSSALVDRRAVLAGRVMRRKFMWP